MPCHRQHGGDAEGARAFGLQPARTSRRLTARPELVAVDLVGAGEGDVVLVALGAAARETEQTRGVPTDAAVVAIVDPAR